MSIDFIGGFPESLTQELLVGKLLVGGLGILVTILIALLLVILITSTTTNNDH